MQAKMKLNGGKWGGLRMKAGRTRKHSRGVAHSEREKVEKRQPLHVNFKFRINLRNKETLRLLKRSIRNARKQGLNVLNYSFQHNHIHLVVNAESNAILTKGMRSLTITFAKGVKRGRVQVERYHLHVLKTVKEVKHTLHYVLFNQQKHESGTCSTIDDYSSILSMERGMELIRLFAKKKRMTLKIEKGESWKADPCDSYLYKKGLLNLFLSETVVAG